MIATFHHHPQPSPKIPVGFAQEKFFVRAYQRDKNGRLLVMKIVESEDQAASLTLAETLCGNYAGAIAFALFNDGRPVMRDLGRYGQTPDEI
jgi:hypothetical protein